ncbi:MAG: SCP2 sterol-binding domain-containing protein, partial [Caldilineaceae bacterium]|nr:SCP2 sterol-binding domain-containing protein [Caldilineaceae bacterium]
TKRVGNGIRPNTIASFLSNLGLAFQKNQAAGLAARYHMTFTGREPAEATITIRNQTVTVEPGHVDKADLRLTADSDTWLKFLAKESGLLWPLLRRKIRVNGNPRLMLAFGRCFAM